MRDIVAGNVKGLAIVRDTSDQNVGMGMTSIVVVHGHPVQAGFRVALHLVHKLACETLEVANGYAIPPATR